MARGANSRCSCARVEEPSLDVTEVKVTPLSRTQLAERIVEHARTKRPLTVGYLNAHGSNLARRHAGMRAALSSFDLVLCDSRGLQLACWMLGYPVPPAVTSIPGLYGLPQTLVRERLGVFLLGSAPGVAARAAERLQRDHPGLQIAGTHHGFFSRFGVQNAQMIEQVNRSGADLLFVGLGMPEQEEWIARNRALLRPSVVVAIGAGFEWIAGVYRPAPAWVRFSGCEWLWRLGQSPRRLWRRYLIGNPEFLARVLLQRARQRR